MADISDFRFSLAPPATLEGETILTIAFTLSADFDAAAAPWVMFSAADGFAAGGFDIQSTDFTYDAAQNRFTLIYHMLGTAGEGGYFLREIDLIDKSGNRIVYTAAYFDQQGFDFIETLSNPYADNNAPTVDNFFFTTPVFNAQTNTWDVTARYDATDATGIAMADAYLSCRDGQSLYGPQAIKYSSVTVDGSHYEFTFSLPYYAKSGDYSLLYIVNDNSNNTNAYMFQDSLPFVRIDNPNEDVTPPILENFSITAEFVSDGSGGLRPVLRVSGKLDVTSSGQSSTNLLVYSPDYTPQNGHYFDYFLGNVGDGSFSADIKLASPAPEGIYTFFLEGFDNAGNVARYASDALLPVLPTGTLSLGQLGFATQVAVYAPDASYDPSIGIQIISTSTDAIIFGGSGNDTLVGDNGSNQLLGGFGNDVLMSGSGNDIVNGGDGNDLIIGGDGAGNDNYNGGDGADTVKYTSAVAAITVNLTTGSATSTAGGDAAGIGTDVLFNIENVIAGNYNDTLIGNAGANALKGGDGNDLLIGGLGNDNLTGGNGIDTVSYAGAGAAITVSLASTSAQLTGGAGSDTLTTVENLIGGDWNDTLTGSSTDNRIEGGAGNDTISGGTGNDTLVGGTGNDIFVVDVVGDTVIEAVDAGTDNIQSIISWTLGDNIENLTLTGTAAISATGNALNNILIGNSAANTLTGGSGNDTLTGIGGIDTFNVSAGTDTITDLGNGGADILNVSVGATVNATVTTAWTATATTVNKGTANITTNGLAVNLAAITSTATGNIGYNVTNNGAATTLTGSSLGDRLYGGTGNDVLVGGAGTDTLDGKTGSDIFIIAATGDHAAAEFADTGTSGTDEVRFTSTTANSTLTLYAGDTGIERAVTGTGTGATATTTGTTALNINASALTYGIALIGNAGANVLTGGVGNDTLQGGAGNDMLNGGAGFDFADYSNATTAITANLSLTTSQNPVGAGSDTITDIEGLIGGSAGDSLTGNSSNNTLFGRGGNDVLTGGAGSDWFVFDTAPNATSNKDTITDFASGTDKLYFSKAAFAGLTLGNLTTDAFWSGAGVTAAHDATDRLIYNTTTGALYYDADGTGVTAAVQVALLGSTTHPALLYSDLVVF